MKKNELVRKGLALMLAGVLAVSVAGCGDQGKQSEGSASDSAETKEQQQEQQAESDSGEQNGSSEAVNEGWFPIVDEQITISAAGVNVSTVDWNETDMVAWFGEKMGILMNCSQYETDAWSSQFSLMLASDDLPDLLVNPADISVVNQYVEDGYFLAISDYLDYAPNLKAFLEEHPDYKAMCTAADGNIYGLVQYNDNKYARLQRAFIDRVWLENVGMEYPKTVEELYETLKAFKEKDANGNGDSTDEIPVSGDTNASWYLAVMSAFGMPVSDTAYGLMLSDGTVTLAQTTENYQAYLTYMNRLYSEGLYDEAALVQNSDEFVAKARDGRVGTFGAAAPFVTLGQDASVDAGYMALGGLTSEWNATGAFPLAAGVSSGVKLLVKADTAYPEAIVRLIDYFYTDDGILMAAKGTEKSVKMEENPFDASYQQAITFIPDGEEDNYDSAEAYRYKKAIINEGFNVIKSMEGSEYSFVDSASDELLASEEVAKTYGWSVLMERRIRETGTVDVMPALLYQESEANRRNTLYTDISNYIRQAAAQFISGELDPETDYESYLNTLKQMKLEELIQIEQAAYDRMY
nr:extracellular solute-binding protein [uncultured Acetatifactor sp.]